MNLLQDIKDDINHALKLRQILFRFISYYIYIVKALTFLASYFRYCPMKLTISNLVNGRITKFPNHKFSTDNTDRHDITELLLKVALNNITLINSNK